VLIGSGEVGRTLAAADPLARRLRDCGACLSVHSVVNAAVFGEAPGGYLN
jgi:hypothetical protein